MSTLTLYHNPRCSKSRQAMALLDDAGVAYQTRLYLKEPLSAAEIKTLIAQLEGPASALVRTKEADYAASGLSPDSNADAIAKALADYPKLLERPLLSDGKSARIGRPPEQILELI
ncbi:arsenate reductase (glutaredoxin) [Saccharospirillum sp. MSK14-1]|uniref:arsenate reductase (glutaredoxin) n=1 Tax=Saccharospirillum sp. MSK14-1 TaxID=1897632 RepID=UPI000D348F50|nr:arsenate reductase (glutaredoxin) [Saccharospirillum sp. MSK14-1]PTY36718.1 arsenate reductase (glutaredoxin) [Saccharospirillum sp. MSK14-1]